MFTIIEPLLANSNLTITLASNNGSIIATVIPVPKPGATLAAPMAVPLQITGTAADLDARFAGEMMTFQQARTGYASTLQQATSDMAKAATPAKPAGKTATRTAAPAAPGPATAPAVPATAAAPAPAPEPEPEADTSFEDPFA